MNEAPTGSASPGPAPQSQFGHTPAEGGAEYVWASGRLDASTSQEFEAVLRAAEATGALWIVLDLSAVGYMSSSGLKAVITAWRASRARGGVLALSGLGPRLLEIFNMVGFTQLFPLYATAAEALAAAGTRISNPPQDSSAGSSGDADR